MSLKIPIAIIGATGYTGLELTRILISHPHVEIKALTSEQYAGLPLSKVYPSLSRVEASKICEKLDVASLAKKVEAAFLCLPHQESQSVVGSLRAQGVRVIDLSADFRIKDTKVYEKWYGKHTEKDLLREAVYGLPELHRSQIKKAALVACPGCYPTSVILALLPLLEKRLVSVDDIICDSKSGVSGAGRGLKVESLFCEAHNSLRPYSVGSHRHSAEMDQELSLLAQTPVKVLFVPHLVPMDRGILSTIYVKPTKKWMGESLRKVFEDYYHGEPFVHMLPEGQMPTTKGVQGTNDCHVNVVLDDATGKIIVLSAIDNLTKGASGQAVQCFNLMFGLTETTGLEWAGLYP